VEYVAPGPFTILSHTELAHGLDGSNIYVINNSSEPIVVTEVSLSECVNVWNPCVPARINRRLEPGQQAMVLTVRYLSSGAFSDFRYGVAWQPVREAASSPAARAAPMPATAPTADLRQSCVAVSFGPWSGPTGPLAASSARRVFFLTADPVPAPGSAPAATVRARVAQLLDGPSFGDLAPAVAPTWVSTSGSGGLVITLADSTKGLSIELVPSDSGLVGIAIAHAPHMVRDTSGAYTTVAARAAVRARTAPCGARPRG
jgi:hypothetical protein